MSRKFYAQLGLFTVDGCQREEAQSFSPLSHIYLRLSHNEISMVLVTLGLRRPSRWYIFSTQLVNACNSSPCPHGKAKFILEGGLPVPDD